MTIALYSGVLRINHDAIEKIVSFLTRLVPHQANHSWQYILDTQTSNLTFPGIAT